MNRAGPSSAAGLPVIRGCRPTDIIRARRPRHCAAGRGRALAYSKKSLRAAVSRAEDVARVVDDERVGHDEMRPCRELRPVRKVVVVAIGVVDEAALFDDELARVDAHLAAVPAQRAVDPSSSGWTRSRA